MSEEDLQEVYKNKECCDNCVHSYTLSNYDGNMRCSIIQYTKLISKTSTRKMNQKENRSYENL